MPITAPARKQRTPQQELRVQHTIALWFQHHYRLNGELSLVSPWDIGDTWWDWMHHHHARPTRGRDPE